MTKDSADKTKLDAEAVFDKQAAVAAVDAFGAGQLSALAVAGHLPSALKRIEDLEAVYRACLAALRTPPETATEVRAQLGIVGEGIAALWSLDDLGVEANAQAERDQQELWKRHAVLVKLLKDLEAKELPR